MVTMFGRQRTEGGLDARIAELSARRARVDGTAEPANAPLPERPAAPVPAGAPVPVGAPVSLGEPEATIEERLAVAREELSARLGAEIRPERRALLSRGDMAKIVDAAVQAYFVRHAMDANPLARRDLITDILQSLIAPDAADAGNRRNPHKAAIEAAKAQIQPLVLEHMDVGAAAEMPRPAFEAQLTGWVKELLAETKIQLNFTEQRELVESLIADMLGLGPLEPADRRRDHQRHHGQRAQADLRRAARQARSDRRAVPRQRAPDEHLHQDRDADRSPHRRVAAARRCPPAGWQPGQHHHPAAGDRRGLDLDPQILQKIDHPRHHGRQPQHLAGKWRRC